MGSCWPRCSVRRPLQLACDCRFVTHPHENYLFLADEDDEQRMGAIRGKCQSYILRAEELKKLVNETAPTPTAKSPLPFFHYYYLEGHSIYKHLFSALVTEYMKGSVKRSVDNMSVLLRHDVKQTPLEKVKGFADKAREEEWANNFDEALMLYETAAGLALRALHGLL